MNLLEATIDLSLYYRQEKDSLMGMENVLRALTLFNDVGIWLMPKDSMMDTVEFAWHCLQPPKAMGCFDVYLQDLVRKGLVEIPKKKFGSTCLCIDDLVRECIAMKFKHVNLHMGEEVRRERDFGFLCCNIWWKANPREYHISFLSHASQSGKIFI
jgi:hypothetical protein